MASLPAPSGAETSGLAEWPPSPGRAFSAFGSLSQFKDAQRMALMLAHASIVPEAYRGDEHIGDCVIALEIANRIGASILAVMQNLLVVQGKPGWSSQFLISCVNATRRFSPIRYQMTGTRGEDSWGCIAWAVDKSGEPLKSPEVTLKMAKDEGWYHRPGSKWKTMPELMLCYRSATLFTRLYAPEITMGIQTTEEMADMGATGNGQSCRPIFESEPGQHRPQPEAEDQAGRQVPIRFSRQKDRKLPESNKSLEPLTTGSQAVPVSSAPAQLSKPIDGNYNYLKALEGLMRLGKHLEAEVLRFLQSSRRCSETATSLAEVAQQQPEAIAWAHDNWQSVDRELNRIKKDQAV
jgi:hypothetical protein